MLTVDAAETRIRLWLLGASYAQIALTEGVSKAAIQQTIKRAKRAGLCPQERTRETMADARAGHVPGLPAGPWVHQGRPRALDAAQVAAIRASDDTNAALARRFGVSRTTVRNARLGAGGYAMGGK